MAQKIDFDERVEYYKKAAKSVGQDFEDIEDDWVPILFIETREEQIVIPLLLPNEKAKELTTSLIIPTAIKLARGEFAVLVISAWMVSMENPGFDPGKLKKWSDLPGPPPSQHPDRIEILQVIAAEKTALKCGTPTFCEMENNLLFLPNGRRSTTIRVRS